MLIGAVLLLAAAFRLYHLNTLPPGLFQDEAINGVNAQTIIAGAPRWYYGEREPLYMYVAALTTLLLGANPLALRLASALSGIVGVAAGGAFGRSLFGPRIGLLTAFGLAVSLWLVDLSRIGFRAITLPAVEYLGLALFWRATLTGRRRDYLLGGALLGLSLYTYLSARFLPFALVGFAVVALVRHRDWLRPRLGGMFLAGTSAFLVCVPLGGYALRHPVILFGRPDQVALPSGSAFWPALLANVPRVLGMLAIQGDLNWRHNLSGAPVFEVLDVALFLLGVVVALRWRKPETSFVLILATVMLVPSMLSQDSPHYLRTIGASGALYALWALGADRAARGIGALARRRWGGGVAARASTAFFALVLVTAAGRTARDYFVLYARSPQLRDAYASDLTGVGQFLAASPVWNENHRSVYLPSGWIDNRGSIAYFLYPRLAAAERARWIDPTTIGTFVDLTQSVPLPVRASLYIVPASDATTARILGPDVRGITPIADRGEVVARAIAAAPLASAPSSLGVHFGRWLELEGASSDATTTTLRWKVLATPPYQPSVFVHFEDQQHHTIAQGDSVIGIPVVAWQVGAEFVTLHVPRWPPGTPPGRYHLMVGVYDKEGGRREPATQAGKTLAEVDAGFAVLADAVGGHSDVAHPFDRTVAPGLRLRGADVPASAVEAGSTLPVTLLWEAIGPTRDDLQVGILLRSADGTVLREWWGRPAGDAFPTSRWRTSQTIRQIQDLMVPPSAAGAVLLEVTARVTGEARSPAIEIARFAVKPSPHNFTPPTPSHRLNARFNGVGSLIGADFPDRVAPGRPVPVVLYWRADAATSTPETVFVHLLDGENHVVGQRDEPPLHGARPTTGWIHGEYLTDSHDLPVDPQLQPGTYEIEVGMYDPRSGARASTGTPANRIVIGSIQAEAAPPAG